MTTRDETITLTVTVSVPKAEIDDLLVRVGEWVAKAVATRPHQDVTLQVDGERLAEAVRAVAPGTASRLINTTQTARQQSRSKAEDFAE